MRAGSKFLPKVKATLNIASELFQAQAIFKHITEAETREHTNNVGLRIFDECKQATPLHSLEHHAYGVERNW